MKTFSATDAAISGFVLVREHFKAVAVWILLATIASASLNLISLIFFGPQMQVLAAAQLSGQTDTEEVRQAMVQMGPFLLLSIVYILVYYGVLQGAVYRTMLRPAERTRAALRLGADELRLIVVSFLIGLLITVGSLGVAFVLGVVVGVFAIISKPLAALLGLVAFVGLLGGIAYAAVRLSLASVQTFVSRRIVLFSTLPLTAGRFWPLLGAYFVAFVMAVIVYLLIMAIIFALGTAFSGGDLASAAKLVQPDFSSLETFLTPMGVLQLALGGLMAVLSGVTMYAPAPAIYREIAEPESTIDPNATGPFAV